MINCVDFGGKIIIIY